MSNSEAEADVFLQLAKWLDRSGYRFFVHVPHTHRNLDSYAEVVDNYPTHSISIGPYKPDILGFTPSNRIFAVEVKGDRNLRKGIGQALSYQRGVDYVFLAADVSSLGVIEDLAVSKGIGVFAVGDEVDERHPSSADMRDLLYNTRSQLEGLLMNLNQDSLLLPSYTDPLNELVPVIAVGQHSRTTSDEILHLCKKYDYSFKSNYRTMIRLATYLGLISKSEPCQLTSQGELGKTVLEGYGVKHIEDIEKLKGDVPLFEKHPPVATFLRNRFASIPDFRTIFEVLLKHNQERISIHELCKTLIENYPSTFLNVVYVARSDSRDAPHLIEQGRGKEIYDDVDYLSEIIQSQFISNTASQFKNLGILGKGTPKIEPKGKLDPKNHYWYLEDFRLG